MHLTLELGNLDLITDCVTNYGQLQTHTESNVVRKSKDKLSNNELPHLDDGIRSVIIRYWLRRSDSESEETSG